MKAKVIVMPKTTVLDPQGAATGEAMKHLGMEKIGVVRVGKCIEIEADEIDRAKLDDICRDLLSNPVIEDYSLEIES